MLLNPPIKLSKSEKENIAKAFEELYFVTEYELIQNFQTTYDKINMPVGNTKFKNSTKEEVFFHLGGSSRYHLLCLFYLEALENDDPKLLLNAFYTFNHLESQVNWDSGVDHSDRIKEVLMCYAGNNFEIIDFYWPKGIALSKKGHRFSITCTNLILALRNKEYKRYALEKTEAY